MPVDENDPIDLAMSQRKAAGATDTQINAADAKKKKIQIPQPLSLTIDKPKEVLLTFLTAEMIAAEESKAPAASPAKAGKSVAAADFTTDPIDYSVA